MKDPIRLLLIEDNPGDARLVKETLAEVRASQFELATAKDLAGGLAHLASHAVDAILLDLTLPDSAGFDTFKRVNEQAPQLPIILLTGLQDEELAVEAAREGAQDYLIKGKVDGELLARSIRYGIERKRMERAIFLMSDTQQQIAHLDDATEIRQLVGKKIQELVGDGYVVVTMLDEQIQAINVVGLFGMGNLFTDLVRQFNMDPSKIAYPLKDMTAEELRLFRSGRLEKFEGGMYALLTRKIPQFICDVAERQMKISGIYTMGFISQETFYGGLTLLAKGDIAPYKDMIETIMNQATISIKRIRAEELLRESEQKYRLLVDNASETILVAQDGMLKFVNRMASELSGYSEQELTSRPFPEFIYPDDRGMVVENYQKRIQGDVSQPKYAFRLAARDGSIKWVEIDAVLIEWQGRPATLNFLNDITERKRAEETLQKDEQRLASIYDTVGDVLFYLAVEPNEQYRFDSVNAAFGRVTGLPLDQVIGRKVNEVIPEPSLTMVLGKYRQAIEEKTIVRWEEISDYPIGRLTGEVSIAPIFDGAGNCTYMVGSVHDITERRQAEQALRESEERFRIIFEKANDAIYIVNANDEILAANPRACEMTGYSLEELLKMQVPDLQAPEVRRSASVFVGDSAQHGASVFEGLNLHRSGRRIPVEISVGRIERPAGDLYVSIVRDITERKQAEDAMARQAEELRQSNEELARLYRASGSLLSGASLSLQELAQAIVGVVQQEFGQSNCSLLVVDRDSKELQRLATAGPYAGQVKNKALSLDGAGLVPQAIRTGETLNVGSVRSMPNYLPYWEAAQSELTIPLKLGSEVIGAIDIQSDQPDAFNANDERLMATFAERAALALAHSRLYGQAQVRVQQLAALRIIDMAISSSFDINLTLGILLDQLRAQLGIHAADILVYNPSAQTFRFASGKGFRTQALQHTHLRLGEGFAGRAALAGRVLKIADLRAEPAGLNKSYLLLGEDFTAYLGIPLIAKGQIKGVLEVFQREPLVLTAEEQAFLEILAGQAAIAIDNAELFDHLQSSVVDLNIAYDSTLEGWSRALDLRNKETEGHTLREAELTERLARAMGIEDAELVQIRRGALLHDIGKMALPDSILFKPDKLNDEEWVLMRQHPQLAYDMLSPIAYLRPALDIAYAHHERWDGSGYPRGLQGEQIPLAARIFAIIDVWDGIISERSYHPARPEAVALEYIRSSAGTHFDPRVVTAFLGMQR